MAYFILLFEVIVSKRICFINSPSQLICLNEFFFLKKERIRSLIIIGFPTSASLNQIKLINLEASLVNKIIFLSDYFREKHFKIFLNIIKIILIFNKETIIGDFNYYLSKGFYKYSRKTIFLDEGINFLRLKNSDLKNKYSFFSTFRNKNLQSSLLLNEYSYLRKKINKYLINENEIYILGTSDPNYELFEKKYYEELINDVCSKNYDKKIIFIPHRNEPIENLYKLNIPNLVINKIYYPIEYYLTKIQFIPKTFYGFYTSALNNLRVLLKDLPVKIFNINFDLKKINNPEVYKLYMNYQSLFSELKIEQFYKN